MEIQKSSYVLFPSHSDGLALEEILKSREMKYTIVPTPRQLSKCCGISIMIDPENAQAVQNILDNYPDIKSEGIHTLEKKKRNWFG